MNCFYKKTSTKKLLLFESQIPMPYSLYKESLIITKQVTLAHWESVLLNE